MRRGRFALHALLLLLAVPCFSRRAAWCESDATRMRSVLKGFVAETGYRVLGVGSWIRETGYTVGQSDHDMRLILPPGTPTEKAQAAWKSARDRLVDAIRTEFGQEADGILRRTNLYAPSQLMTAVEDLEDAAQVYRRLQQVPSLGHLEAVTENTPAKFAEGLYGEGSQAFTQFYEQGKGRLFYRSGQTGVTGATSLAHFEEGRAVFTVEGTANTARQWGEHALEAVQTGDVRSVRKQLARLDRDLAKSRALAGLATDTALRQELRDIQRVLDADPAQLRSIAVRIRDAVQRTGFEAGMLKVYGGSGPLRQGIVRLVMDAAAAPGELGHLLQRAHGPVAHLVTLDALCKGVVGYFAAVQISRAYADGWLATAKEVAAFYSLLPTGIMMQITDAIIEQTKEAGYELVASSQEAWDLMSGVYTAWGRGGLDPNPRRRFTLDMLLRDYQDEAPLKTLVYSQALRASSRNLGGVGDDIDRSVADAIFAKCWPVILQAWRWKRDEAFGEYTEIARGIPHTPLVILYTPAPARIAGGSATVRLTVSSLLPNLTEQLERMSALLKLLGGKDAAVPVDYEWVPAGEEVGERTSSRDITFSNAGLHPVKVHLRVWPVAPGLAPNDRLLIRRDAWAGIDVEVQPGPAVSPELAKLHKTTTFQANMTCDRFRFQETRTGKSEQTTFSYGFAIPWIPISWSGTSFRGTKPDSATRVEGTVSPDGRTLLRLEYSHEEKSGESQTSVRLHWKDIPIEKWITDKPYDHIVTMSERTVNWIGERLIRERTLLTPPIGEFTAFRLQVMFR